MKLSPHGDWMPGDETKPILSSVTEGALINGEHLPGCAGTEEA